MNKIVNAASGVPIAFSSNVGEPAFNGENVVTKGPLARWLADKMTPEIVLDGITVQAVKDFYPPSNDGPHNPGLVFAEAKAFDHGGTLLPGVMFLRGDSVAIATFLRTNTGDFYAVLTRQPRVPAGRYVTEIPAGMMDGEGNPKAKALEELSEETGITFGAKDVRHLGDQLWVTPGGSDERMHFVLAMKTGVDPAIIEELEGRETGLQGEQITLRLLEVQPGMIGPTLMAATADMKSVIAGFLCDDLERRRKFIP